MTSLRNRRVRIYRYADAGGGGTVSAKYTFTIERWAAVHQRSALEIAAAGAGAENIHAVVDFAAGTDVRYNDLLIDGDKRYFVRGVTDQAGPDATLVTAERVKREVFLSLNVDLSGTIVDGVTSDVYDPSVVES